MLSLLDSLSFAANECLPTPGKDSKNKKLVTVPNWQDEIKPFKENAMFWNAVWQSAGRPINSVLHNVMKRTRNVYHLLIRKNKRMANTMKKNKILAACFADNQLDIFKEIKKLRRCPPSVATCIDDESDDIPNHFANIYKDLYNSVNDNVEVEDIRMSICRHIKDSCIEEVIKVTPEVVRRAASHLRTNKSDPAYNYSSDCFKNAPDVFYRHLSDIFQEFLIHGHVSSILLISTLVPLVKDKLGDICVSSNYRSIALSSLVLKIFDWVIILLYGDKLNLDSLQFGYQQMISTNMCTWTAVETIDYFTRNGSEVYVCALDMSKAFDRVKHCTLFEKLCERKIPNIFIRLLIYMYRHQSAQVRWDSSESDCFSLSNGVKQGAVLSAILYCVYVDDLYRQLRKEKSGCWINGNYYGILGYSDDILLLAPTISALKQMLKTCEKFAVQHNLQFSTNLVPAKSKCKCIAFGCSTEELPNLVLCNNKLPWVNTIKHLGTVLTNDKEILGKDVMQKRAAYVSRNNELLQEFHFAHPKSLVKINHIYNSSYYGCVLWNYQSKEVERIDKSWNVSMRKLLRLPFNTHRYFLEPISQSTHARYLFYSRFLKFTDSLRLCQKAIVRNLYQKLKHDCRSNIGLNLRQILLLSGKSRIKDITPDGIKGLVYVSIPSLDHWKIKIVKEIQEVLHGDLEVNEFSRDAIEEIKEFICTT